MLHTVATAWPTSRPVRCMISYVGSVGEPPGDRLDRGTRRLGIEAPTRSAQAAPAVGLDDRVADAARRCPWHLPAADRSARCHPRRRSTRPWPRSPACPAPHPTSPSASASAFAPRSPYTLRLVADARLERNGNDRHAAMCVGDTATDIGTHRPGATDADGDRSSVVMCARPLQLSLRDRC